MSELEELLKKSRGRARRHPSNKTLAKKDAKVVLEPSVVAAPSIPPLQTSGGFILQDVAARSTSLVGVGYNKPTKTLVVMFKKNWAVYHYDNVPLKEFNLLIKSDHPGTELKGLIKRLSLTFVKVE